MFANDCSKTIVVAIRIILLSTLLFAVLRGNTQLLTWSPSFITESSNTVEITCDATKGNQGLRGHSPLTDVYVHIGVITTKSTSASDWKYVKFTWGTTNTQAQCSSLGNNQWKYTITGGLRTFFGITDATERITKISILFRSGDGNKVQRNTDGSDMYVPVYTTSAAVRIDEPFRQPLFTPTPEPITKTIGESININAKASESANLRILFNGTQVATQNAATTITASTSITAAGNQQIIAEAVAGSTTVRDTLNFFVSAAVNVAPLPAGVKDGINYQPGDTSAVLVLYAPGKSSVMVLGDFNNWTAGLNYQMNRTEDGNRHWLRITGLTPGTEYAYQYLVDGTLRVADYNTEKVLDPFNDPFIPASNYPSLKAYPTGKTTGIVSVLQTAKPAYNWQVPNFTRPDKRNLLVYELLVRDFIAAQNWNVLRDTLTYLKRLGINAIHVMPFNEFEGNNSWGYNPSFYFAPDKMYGTENALRQFIDECHKQGIAVIMDMVLNHSFGQSPMVQLYWDGANNKPANNNPWFNPDAKHPFNVGYDMNHDSQATKDFVARVVRHWLVNYKIDGFRWDLSKGFTQTNNPNDVNAWGNTDITRINTWKRIYDSMQAVLPGSYCILEHFANNDEETQLANYGMLLWGNSNFAFREAVKATNLGNSNFDWGLHTRRGWSQPHLMTYMESHDEERIIFDALQNGSTSNTGHLVNTLPVALKRAEMAAAFWAMMPGPKLMWQFGELGYDQSINRCENGSINNDCRTAPKPVLWNYRTETNRAALYNVYRELFRLRRTPNYFTTFTSNSVSQNFSGAFKTMTINSDSLVIVVVGNFGVTATTSSVNFPTAGTWYSYLTGTTVTAAGGAQNVSLAPAEYHIYTNKDVRGAVTTAITPTQPVWMNEVKLEVGPNPLRQTGTITYTLPLNAQVGLYLTDMQGNRIAQLFNGRRNKGVYQQSLNLQALSKKPANGFYVIEMRVNGQSKTTKLIIQ